MVALVNRNDVRAKETVITPAVAAGWLQKMAPNRHVNEKAVDRYAADMRAGRWQSNGCTIVMGKSGQILDGQHRLRAIVKADEPVSMIVVSGVDDEAFATIDTGRPRSVSDVLAVMGYPSSLQLAAVARMSLVYQDTGEFNITPLTISNQQVLAVATSRAEEFNVAINAVRPTVRILKGSSGVWSVLWMAFGKIDPLDRDSFFEGMSTGVNLQDDSPVFALRRLLLERATSKHGTRGVFPVNILGALIVKAWNKYRAHERVSVLKWSAGESFPVPI